ncbi:hypothetical protein JKP88DRAFT_176989 [Tribonema minus]|uniref:Hydroxyproline O-arabinosyltransferase-like domain-containing protein n=1 Tax=Tribonema minus TaxID=303371 RepID=A0A835ZI64_9STRA|nr:hypothetical protein JKP88DRAFT_176989 [Tribonema minus]
MIVAEHCFPCSRRRIADSPDHNVGEKRGVDLTGITAVPRDEHDVHVVFSTECSSYQDWQSLLLFFSATRAGHKGPITRLAGGCSPEKQTEILKLHQHMPPHHRVHFTPDYSVISSTGHRYPYYNKPFGMQHFLATANPPITNTIVAVLDPDQVFMKPLTPFLDPDTTILADRNTMPPLRFNGMPVITEGYPASQRYGLGSEWRRWDGLGRIVQDEKSPALTVDPQLADDHYPIGPPYVAHVRDWLKMADKWVEFMPRSLIEYPHLLSEMFALCIASAHLRLPHTVVRTFMVSNADDGNEGWPLIDKLSEDEVCNAHNAPDTSALPVVIHYCQHFRVGIYSWGKWEPKLQELFKCDSPYLLEPPDHLASLRIKIEPDHLDGAPLSPLLAKRHAFVICALTKILNEALRDFRKAMCPSDQQNPTWQLTDVPEEQLKNRDKWEQLGAT